MLIGLLGGICAGKHAVADYLVAFEGFTLISIPRSSCPSDYPISEQEILNCVTRDSQKRWVTVINGFDKYVSKALLGRPFFLLVYIDAPLLVRWTRYKDRCSVRGNPKPDIEDFVSQNDDYIYNPSYGIYSARHQAHLGILNSSESLPQLHLHLKSINLADESRLRPTWDQYFMELASLASLRSNCMKRRVGCVLVRQNRVISTGYNGTPRGLKNCNEGGCKRCNQGSSAGQELDVCLCIHAEENALLEAGRERVGIGSVLYCDTCPCLTCSIKIAQVGISEVVYNKSYSMDSESAAVFKAGGIYLRQFSPLQKGLFLVPTNAGSLLT